MRQVILALVLICSTTLEAGGRRRGAAVSPLEGPLPITFVDAAAAGVLDAGPLSAAGARTAKTRRTVAMRIGKPQPGVAGTVTLRAFLEAPDARCTIRVDGLALSSAPRVIERHVPIGVVTLRRIEIEVPPTAPEGAVQFNIRWEVTTE